MKRHPLLVPLSQEHHHTLALCLRILRHPEQSHRDDINNHFVDLEQHFFKEEQMFAPLWASLNRPDLHDRFSDEHARLRVLYRDADFDDAAWNTEFATLLREHARFEERELFPALETVLPPQ